MSKKLWIMNILCFVKAFLLEGGGGSGGGGDDETLKPVNRVVI